MTTTPEDEGLPGLEQATEALVEQVAALAGALQAIGETQASLQKQVTAVKEDVQENAVPKHEFDLAQAATVEARAKLQTRIRVFAIGTALVALAVAVAAGVLSAYVAVHVSHGQRVAACKERNRQTIENAAKTGPFFQPYLDQEKHNPKADPVMVQLITAIVNTPPQLTDCTKL
jgi:hypothetical protein